jgi:hypothetical protein
LGDLKIDGASTVGIHTSPSDLRLDKPEEEEEEEEELCHGNALSSCK